MNKTEVNQLLALMKANYSYAFKNMSQQDKYLLVNTWAFVLRDIPADIAMLAAMQLISKSKWLPTAAEIREGCRKLHHAAVYDQITVAQWQCAEWTPPGEMAEQERQRKMRAYIARSTAHLGESADGELTLSAMLEGTGLGELNMAMLTEGEETT